MSYDRIACIYDADMGASMRFDDIGWYVAEARRVGGEVLELGCGTGRVLRGLYAAGIEAVGVDLSLPMLRQAQAKLRPGAKLAQMDLQSLGLRRAFSLALLPYSLVTYLLDGEAWHRMAEGVRGALVPGGRVVLDAFVPRPGLDGRGWQQDYARRLPQGWLVRHKRIEAESHSRRLIRRRYRLHGSFGGRTLQTQELIRVYSPDELRAHAQCWFGTVERIAWNYGAQDVPEGAQFFTATVRLRNG